MNTRTTTQRSGERRPNWRLGLAAAGLLCCAHAGAQDIRAVRNRELYQPPELPAAESSSAKSDALGPIPKPPALDDDVDGPTTAPPRWNDHEQSATQPSEKSSEKPGLVAGPAAMRIAQDDVPEAEPEEFPVEDLLEPQPSLLPTLARGESSLACDGCVACDARGEARTSCDSACDEIGNHSLWHWPDLHRLYDSSNWYASADYILWWRSGYDLPPLVTTSPAGTDIDDAGVLGLSSTTILAGEDRYSYNVASGVRFVVGYWLDRPYGDALELRVWGTGDDEQKDQFNSFDNPILARPFYDLSPGQAPSQTAQLVAFPTESVGRMSIESAAESFGWDFAMSQLLGCYAGTRWDLLYGYQGMRVNEGLQIQSQTIVTNSDGLPPIGATLNVTDQFGSQNEFHAGMIGLRAMHRGTRWSWSSAVRMGFGGVNRTQLLNGLTTTVIDDDSSTDPIGLLVQRSNAGEFHDTEFAVSPQFDLRLTYRWTRSIDLSLGYDFVGLANAVSPGGAIAPGLALNLAPEEGGPPMPQVAFGDRFYWQHGLSFGLQWNR